MELCLYDVTLLGKFHRRHSLARVALPLLCSSLPLSQEAGTGELVRHHDPVVEVTNVSLKGLAFSGAVHISLVEDQVTTKAAILKNKATARIF